ncbi:MAG: bifunctional phosphoglucose/phosphomannose isomerase [Saprospiraceae bacterium]|nr:bifunctional phosphoglucose/phosphomannose isomerase [Saprospiraceae bacterium]
MMDQLIKKFPAQLKEALEIGEEAKILSHPSEIRNIIMAGMGGSGIGGAFVADIISGECKCPFNVVSGYILPTYINTHSLIIISSYSGNTEETLSALQQALKTEAKIVCIASGGKIIDLARQSGLDYIILPSGWPSPRACLGFSLVQQLYILFKLGLISKSSIEQIRTAVDLLIFEQDDIMQKASKIAELLYKKMPVMYSTDRAESIGVRWRQQINENSKMLCWHHVLPEMNHNELVGWKSKHEDLAVIFLRNRDDLKRNQVRMDITKQIVGQYASTVIEIYSKGQSLTEKLMYMVHLGDWVSWYLAQLNNVDASEIMVIDQLKKELDKV